MKMEKACLVFVLNAHLPYVRHPEYDDAFEECWFFEAVTESYLPLLLLLERLVADNIDFRLTLSISPPLATMFTDSFLVYRYQKRLDNLIALAEKEVARTVSQHDFNILARKYSKHLLSARTAFIERYDKDLLQAFKRFQDLGKVEIIAGAATHGYLPLLMHNESAVRAQIRIGIDQYQQSFGVRPNGFWLPECAMSYGIDAMLAAEGIRYTFLETHGITRADPRPANGTYAPIFSPSGLAFFGRDPESSRQVWSSEEGYPGDVAYREFYRDIAYDLDSDALKPCLLSSGIRTDTGFKYYRITGKTEQKEIYRPESAFKKAELHAAHFIEDKENQADSLSLAMDSMPVIVAPFDAELFGHWWHEGPYWLDAVIRKASRSKVIRLATVSDYLESVPSGHVAVPSPSSWGANGYNEVWLNKKNDWIYPHLHQAAAQMARLAAKNPRAKGLMMRALRQAARELLLAQSSDWAFMIDNGAVAEYGTRRTKRHLLRFLKLKEDIEHNTIDEIWLTQIESQDNIFPKINYRLFENSGSSVNKNR